MEVEGDGRTKGNWRLKNGGDAKKMKRGNVREVRLLMMYESIEPGDMVRLK